MTERGRFDDKTLLSTLPKDVAVELQPTEDGEWLASIVGMPALTARGRTTEEAERLALSALHDVMLARLELVQKKRG